MASDNSDVKNKMAAIVDNKMTAIVDNKMAAILFLPSVKWKSDNS